jgi:hypothetical protein
MFIFLHSSHCDSATCPDIAQAWQFPCHRSLQPVHLTSLWLSFTSISACIHLSAFLEPIGHIFSRFRVELWQSWRSINPAFQILHDDRQAYRSCFIMHICPSPIKQMSPLMHTPLVHDSFPIHFDKLAMDFDRANVFVFQKSKHWMHLIIGSNSDWYAFL